MIVTMIVMFHRRRFTMNRNRLEPRGTGQGSLARLASITLALVVAFAFAAPVSVASANGPLVPPTPILGPRLSPPVIPHKAVDLLTLAELTVNALEADAADMGRKQEAEGRGIRQTFTGYGAGLTLYDSPNVCNNFNAEIGWAATDGNPDMWSEWYSGWAPFGLNDGVYSVNNMTFTRERSVGPGDRYNDNEDTDNHTEYSAKIAGHIPYAGGFGSPRIPVPAGFEGGQVMVSVKYLIWDHDQGGGPDKDGIDYDWASMGVKPGADGPDAYYVNGYVRGEWAEMVNVVELGDARDIMVLIQAQSPAFLNSNIYFDDVKIAFTDMAGNRKYLRDCTAEEAIQ
jgi:hypothetical protein